ncbi:hypothetical protein C8R43DRAFT_80034 [Mycena crocata]|nr:hypothetical protein C8R43DRAFT_80034 [Mycena crocata]
MHILLTSPFPSRAAMRWDRYIDTWLQLARSPRLCYAARRPARAPPSPHRDTGGTSPVRLCSPIHPPPSICPRLAICAPLSQTQTRVIRCKCTYAARSHTSFYASSSMRQGLANRVHPRALASTGTLPSASTSASARPACPYLERSLSQSSSSIARPPPRKHRALRAGDDPTTRVQGKGDSPSAQTETPDSRDAGPALNLKSSPERVRVPVSSWTPPSSLKPTTDSSCRERA